MRTALRTYEYTKIGLKIFELRSLWKSAVAGVTGGFFPQKLFFVAIGRRALFSDPYALTITWILANHYWRRTMTLKQQVHLLIEELPDDSPVLIEVHEALRMDHAIGEAMTDARAGRTYSAEEFMAKVRERWPRGGSE